MTAETPGRRKMTARKAAEQLGVSPRTVQRIMAEPRSEFLARAAANRVRALELREQRHTYAEIATIMGLSIGSVSKLLYDARKHATTKQGQASA